MRRVGVAALSTIRTRQENLAGRDNKSKRPQRTVHPCNAMVGMMRQRRDAGGVPPECHMSCRGWTGWWGRPR